MKIIVLGAGAWGSAVAMSAAQHPAGHAVTLWARDPELARDMQACRENRRFLPGFPLPESLRISHDLSTVLDGTDLSIVATPLSGLRATVRQLRGSGLLRPLIWVCKGFEPGSGQLPHLHIGINVAGGTAYLIARRKK